MPDRRTMLGCRTFQSTLASFEDLKTLISLGQSHGVRFLLTLLSHDLFFRRLWTSETVRAALNCHFEAQKINAPYDLIACASLEGCCSVLSH